MTHSIQEPLPRLVQAARSAAKAVITCALIVSGIAAANAQTTSFKVTNILSDGFVPAKTVDPTFINPWGISLGKTFWTNSAKSGYDVLNDTNGVAAFKVTIPGPAAGSSGAPSGTVAQTNSSLFLLPNGKSGSFLFSTLNGTVSGWNGGLGTAGSIAVNMIDNSAQKAVYTDMSLVTNAKGTYLLLANFNSTTSGVEVYDSTWKSATLAGNFTDPALPSGYFPFAVHTIGTQVFVTYIQKNSSGLELVSPGNGIVDTFDVNGTFVARAITGGNLNAPWGMAKAPATYGIYANDLLVGNFGDGIINVYDPTTFNYLGQITDGTGAPIAFPGLWEILFGGGTSASSNGDAAVLYFAAGVGGEAHGLFGSIDNTGTGTPAFALSSSSNAVSVKAGTAGQVTIAVSPTNGFNGAVTLTCSGLPINATCSFAQPSLTLNPAASSTTTMTVNTTGQTASLAPAKPLGLHGGIVAAFALPFLGLLSLRRRLASPGLRRKLILPLLLLSTVAIGVVTGCAGLSPTPAGTSAVTVTASTAGSTKTTTINLIVQ